MFGTSAGRAAFDAYKNKSPLPENVADENGHEKDCSILAEYHRKVPNVLSVIILNEKKKNGMLECSIELCIVLWLG